MKNFISKLIESHSRKTQSRFLTTFAGVIIENNFSFNYVFLMGTAIVLNRLDAIFIFSRNTVNVRECPKFQKVQLSLESHQEEKRLYTFTSGNEIL